MINTTQMANALIGILFKAKTITENSVVEFKVEPHSKLHDCELVKDVLGLANSYDRPNEDRWLIYGVPNDTRALIGVEMENPNLLDDSSYQQKLEKIVPRLTVEYVQIPAEIVIGPRGAGKCFAALYVPKENVGKVYEVGRVVEDEEADKRGRIRKLEVGQSFVRDGSSTRPMQECDRLQIRGISNNSLRQPNGLRINPRYGFASTGTADYLRLLGSWDESSEADRAIVEELCGMSYENAIRELDGDLDAGSFSVVGSRWEIRDRVGALSGIGKHLTGTILQTLAYCFSEVLSSINGMYAMSEGDRILAGVVDVNRGCSAVIRKGAASFCACLSNNRHLVPNCDNDEVDKFVSRLSSAIIDAEDWRVIASSDRVLPLLSEASPAIFLSQVENGLKEGSAITELLGQRSGGFASTGLGSGLVRGLKIASMRGEYLARSVKALVAMASYSEFAKEAIVTTLLPWMPQTNAPVSSRKGMGRFLSRCSGSVAWGILLELLPNKRTHTLGIPDLQYLAVEGMPEKVTLSEFWEVSREYCSYALEGARGNADRIKDIAANIECYRLAGLMSEMSSVLISECSTLSDGNRYPVWIKLADYLDRCSRYPDADWVPSVNDLETLRSVCAAIAPADPYYSVLRLFLRSDYQLSDIRGDYKKCHDEVVTLRRFAFEGMSDEIDFSIAEKLIGDGVQGRLIGEVLAEIDMSEGDLQKWFEMFDCVGNGDEHAEIARSYVWSKYMHNGWEWVNSLSFCAWPPQRIARLYSSIPFCREAWERAEADLNGESDLFWKDADLAPIVDNDSDLKYCVERLLAVDRASATLPLIKHSIEGGARVKGELIMDAIDEIKATDCSSMISFYIQELFKYLENESPCERLCLLELKFCALLEGRSDAYIFKQMALNPALFVDVVSMSCLSTKRVSEGRETCSDSGRYYIRYRLLQNWVCVPGFDESGEFQGKIFYSWLEEARKEAENRGCGQEVDWQIGRNAFHAPKCDSGFFIPDEIAGYLESNETALDGYVSESINSRGVHFVDRTGRKEDEMAESYEAKAGEAEERGYVTLASALRNIAAFYRREADDNRKERLWD